MLQQYIRQFTEKVIDALNVGSMEMVNLQETMLTPDFILIGLLDQEDSVIVKLLQTYFADDKTLANQIVEKVYKEQDAVKKIKITAIHTIQLSPETEILFKQAAAESKNLGDKYIGSGAMFLAMFDPRVGRVSDILLDLGLKYQKVKEALDDMQGGRHINDKSAEGRFEALNRYTTDLTDMARKGELDPVIARENEINRVIQVLSRRKKNNPVLIGETGVGKTVIVDGLAQQIVRAEVPKSLLNKRVKVLEMSEIIAGAKMRGEFEERMKAVKDEIIAANGRIILFIDELHTLVSSGSGGGGIDASDMLKSALAKGQLQCIGATTLDEYKKHIETDKALARRFQPIIVQEPSVKDAIRILSGLKSRYEKHHGVVFREDALTAAAKLSEKYISDRALPDKAVDLLDEAGAQKHLTLNYIPPNIRQLENQKIGLQQSQKDYFAKQDFQEVARIRQELIETEAKLDKETIKWKKDLEKIDASVSDEDIANVVAAWTNIPVNKIRETEANKLMHMEDNLHKRVIGQDNAITALSNAIRRTRAGLKDKDRPIGSFLFLGPTGVGKTELAKALAEFLLDDENRMIRLDMSEYMEKHSVSKIIGSPPGYVGYEEGGQLTEKIRRQPYSVILLDELEKAHPDVFNILLQLLDDGRLTDAQGRVTSFKNAIIIGTSNIGTKSIVQEAHKGIGFGQSQSPKDYNEVRSLVLNEVRKFFKPEFLNRLDDMIVFHKLTREQVRKIVDLMINNLCSRLEEKNLRLKVSDKAKDLLAKEGYSENYGARPLKRLIENQVENALSMKIINGEFNYGEKILVDMVKNSLVFKKMK